MAERDVGGTARFDADGDADDARLHVVERRRLGIEAERFRLPQPLQPFPELQLAEDGLVVAPGSGRRHRGLGRGCCGRFGGRCAGQLLQQRAKLEPRVQIPQSRDVRVLPVQVLETDRQFEPALDRREPPGELELREVLAEALAHLAGDLVLVRDDLVQRAVLVQPLRRGLRTDLRDTGYVVRAVASQREVANHLLRVHVELGLDAVAVERGAGHRVDQRDSRPDQLRHVLVAGRDQDPHAGLGCAPGQRADHVVGFDALDAQHRQAERLDGLDQGLHL